MDFDANSHQWKSSVVDGYDGGGGVDYDDDANLGDGEGVDDDDE